MQNEILWVDDEPLWAERHVEALRSAGFTVHPYDSVDEANTNYDALVDVNGVVLDVMMPGGDLFSEEATSSGQITGILLLQLWKTRLVARNQVVFVLTNRDVAAVDDYIAKLEFPSQLIRVCHKKETSTAIFRDQLKKLLISAGVFRA